MTYLYEVYGSIFVRAQNQAEAIAKAEAGEFTDIYWGYPKPRRRPHLEPEPVDADYQAQQKGEEENDGH